MPETHFPLSKPTLAYAKLVATPTDTSWSQVYNAGNLFACISLTVAEASEEDLSLPAIGKEILDTLHSEFFVLEKKDIASISEVINKSIEHVPASVAVDISLGFFKDNILYLFLLGHGRVIMKRQGKIGKLLESKHAHKEILTASGYLHNEDTVVLETKQFADDINDTTLAGALELELPNDIAEALSPKVLANADGGQAAIIVVYHGVSGGMAEPAGVEESVEEQASQELLITHAHTSEGGEALEDDEGDDDAYEEEPRKKMAFSLGPITGVVDKLKDKFKTPSGFQLTHTRKLFLSIIVVIVILLAGSIFFTKKKQADEKLQQQFQAVYIPAEKKYEDGKALEILNKDVSTQDYLEAKELLSTNSKTFPAGSEESKKVQELLKKIDTELAGASPSQKTNAKEASVPAQSLLGVEKANPDGKGFTQDDSSVYFITDKAITSVSKSSGSKKELVKNENKAWEDPVGIATYLGNIYVLDRKKGIIKFASGGYAQSAYFKDKPNMLAAKDLAIDSSIWIVMQDGTILKYTSGASDGYKAPAFTKKMSGPTKIFTDANTKNLYILDRGNSRVIRIAKEDSSHSEYTSGVISSARDFEVKESDKKILILSGDKTYEIPL